MTQPPPPAVRALACGGCGASLELRAPGRTVTLGCPACGAVLDARHPDAAAVALARQKEIVRPAIPLGARGRLKGETWEVIGFLVRETSIDGDTFAWREYVLHHPVRGIRWLSEYNNHWVLARTTSSTPGASADEAGYLGRTYRHFQTAQARVAYVVGEFPWRVAVGETAVVEDYVSPPYLLSCERTKEETTWSAGEYLDVAQVWKAFALPGSAPAPSGVGAAQPSPFGPHGRNVALLATFFVAAVLAIHLVFTLVSQQRVVHDATFRVAAGESTAVSEPFELTGRRSNVVIETFAPVSNSWLYLHITLLDEATGYRRTFGRELAYYFGRDSDGPWTEGSGHDRVVLPWVPAGRYVLVIEPEAPQPGLPYRVTVRRDVPRPGYAWTAAGLVLLPALLFWYRRHAFEYRRWQESDHPMRKESDSDDED